VTKPVASWPLVTDVRTDGGPYGPSKRPHPSGETCQVVDRVGARVSVGPHHRTAALPKPSTPVWALRHEPNMVGDHGALGSIW